MLTLITVNFNNARSTIALLKSLEDQLDPDFDVIVVDNGSQAEDRALLGEYSASSKLNLDIIYGENNKGFSGGNNTAIRKAIAQGSDWMLVINNDTTVAADFIGALRAKLPLEPAIIGLPLGEGDRIAYAGRIKWLKPTLEHVYLPITQDSDDLYAIGAGVLIHRTIVEKVGDWDEKYFLYFEDADFSVRARRKGVAFDWFDMPIITHNTSSSTKSLGSSLLLRYHYRNALIFNRRYAPLHVKIVLPFWSFWAIIKQLVKIMTMPSRRDLSQSILAGIIDFYAGRTGQIEQKKDKDRHRMRIS